ncbi:UNVERIFIED_CONTAM: hypothetical protein FKN15_033582 [Acipenser sinensis]
MECGRDAAALSPCVGIHEGAGVLAFKKAPVRKPAAACRRDKSLRPSHKVSSGPRSLLSQTQGPFSGIHLECWCQCTTDIWVPTTIETGYSLQFKHGPPPFQGVTPTSVKDQQGAAVVSQEVAAVQLVFT